MKKDKKFPINFVSILVTLSLILGTFIVYFLSKGYRFNIIEREIERTGVITVNSYPRKAKIYIDGEYAGTSPKAIAGIKEGRHTISVKKEGYYTWENSVEVISQQSIPIHTMLFLEETERDPAFLEEDYDVDKLIFDRDNHLAIFSQYTSQEESVSEDESIDDPEQTSDADTVEAKTDIPKTLEIWAYRLSYQFWQTKPQPQKIAEFSPADVDFNDLDLQQYEINIAPNSQRVLVSIKTSDDDTRYFILPTDGAATPYREITTLSRYNNINPTWDPSSQYLIFAKDNELRSYNVETSAQIILFESNTIDEYVWTPDSAGFIYTIEPSQKYFSIYRVNVAGGKREEIFSNVSIQENNPDDSELNTNSPDEDNPTDELTDQTVEPELLKCSSINDIRILSEGKYMLLICPEKILIHTFSKEQTEVVATKTPEFILASPDGKRFLYKTNENIIYQYTIEIDEGDPVHKIGVKELLKVKVFTNYNNFMWLDAEGYNLAFSQQNIESETETEHYSIKVFNTESLQIFLIADKLSSPHFSPNADTEKMIALCKENELCEVIFRE
jgi:hypothetical protein